jgi:hypothetical protein
VCLPVVSPFSQAADVFFSAFEKKLFVETLLGLVQKYVAICFAPAPMQH